LVDVTTNLHGKPSETVVSIPGNEQAFEQKQSGASCEVRHMVFNMGGSRAEGLGVASQQRTFSNLVRVRVGYVSHQDSRMKDTDLDGTR
jgi:hypothetical protein